MAFITFIIKINYWFVGNEKYDFFNGNLLFYTGLFYIGSKFLLTSSNNFLFMYICVYMSVFFILIESSYFSMISI